MGSDSRIACVVLSVILNLPAVLIEHRKESFSVLLKLVVEAAKRVSATRSLKQLLLGAGHGPSPHHGADDRSRWELPRRGLRMRKFLRSSFTTLLGHRDHGQLTALTMPPFPLRRFQVS